MKVQCKSAFVTIVILLSVYCPLRYQFVGGYDVRFAWRMFGISSMKQCSFQIRGYRSMITATEDTRLLRIPKHIRPFSKIASKQSIVYVLREVARKTCEHHNMTHVKIDYYCVDYHLQKHVIIDNEVLHCS